MLWQIANKIFFFQKNQYIKDSLTWLEDTLDVLDDLVGCEFDRPSGWATGEPGHPQAGEREQNTQA